MGVTGLWKLIDQAGKPVPLETLENKVLAIDISIWLHQVVKGFQDSKGGTIPYAHILGLFHRLCKLLFYKIKPIFVFDGGIPDLKRETIRKRNLSKMKFNSEAERIQQLLLNSLAKEKIIQQALGDQASLLTSPIKPPKPSEIAKEDLYKLPPVPEISIEKALESSDGSFDEKSSRQYYNINLNSIDVTSKRFQDLPPDVRHDILTDMKEKRKESSWGRLHELPAQSEDFSEFQMKRLLRRRQVQVSLESAEKEMGGKCLSLAEMETMLTEEGILNTPPSSSAKQIASNENALFLHIKSLKQAMQEEKENEERQKEKEKNNLSEANSPGDVIDLEELVADEDEDMQKAIQLSLLDPVSNIDEENSVSNEVKLRPEQKKVLGNAVGDLAKAYMIEYGGFNADEVKELVMSDDEDKPMESTFRYNDTFILKGASAASPIKKIDDSDSDGVSSDADSDLIDVPDIEPNVSLTLREIIPLEMNKAPDPDMSKDFRHDDLLKGKGFQIEIQKGKVLDDDIFADIFNGKSEIKESTESEVIHVKSDDKPIIVQSNKQEMIHQTTVTNHHSTVLPDAPVLNNILDKLNAEISDITTLELDSLPTLMPSKKSISTTSDIPPTEMITKNQGLSSILNTLNTEINEILEKGLDSVKDIQLTPPKSIELIEINDDEPVPSTSSIFRTPKKPTQQEDKELTPKVVSPFFRKKTPSPRKRKANDDQEEISPKIPKNLFPSISDDTDPLQLAANVLRENKTTDQLHTMAAGVNEEKKELEFERNKQDRLGVNITERMSSDCKNLLKLFGIPYIVAPMEAESQCAFLNQIKLTDGTITDDSDIWLFGGRTVYKHFFNQQKNVLEFQADNIEQLYNLDRHKLIQLSVLVGNDYTNGIQGIGAVTAMEILSEFVSTPVKEGEVTENMSLLSSLRKFREWFLNSKNSVKPGLRSKLKNITLGDDFPSCRVIEAFLEPIVDSNDERFTWGIPDAESIRELAKNTFGWTYSRTDDILLPVLKKLEEKKSQQSIKNYFKITSSVMTEGSLVVSKRVRRAIDVMSQKCKPEDEREKPIKEKRSRKKAANDEKAVAVETGNKKTKTRKTQPKEKQETKQKNNKLPGEGKNIKLPGEGDDIIPQREMDNAEMDKNKQNAIELFKKSKKNQ